MADTPRAQAPNYGKPDFPHVTCNNGPNGDMFMNYMDYVDDAAMFMFTHGPGRAHERDARRAAQEARGALMAERDQLAGRWVHSHEEDTGDEMVFRSADYAFPPSRGRESIELRADGSYAGTSPARSTSRCRGRGGVDARGRRPAAARGPRARRHLRRGRGAAGAAPRA